MKINGQLVIGNKFAYDRCHKIYICEDEDDIKMAKEYGYDIYDIKDIKLIAKEFPIARIEISCPLRFINNWKLDKCYAEQFEIPKFEY